MNNPTKIIIAIGLVGAVVYLFSRREIAEAIGGGLGIIEVKRKEEEQNVIMPSLPESPTGISTIRRGISSTPPTPSTLSSPTPIKISTYPDISHYAMSESMRTPQGTIVTTTPRVTPYIPDYMRPISYIEPKIKGVVIKWAKKLN